MVLGLAGLMITPLQIAEKCGLLLVTFDFEDLSVRAVEQAKAFVGTTFPNVVVQGCIVPSVSFPFSSD